MKLNGNAKWVIGLLVAVLVGIGGWYSFAVQTFANQGHLDIVKTNERQDVSIAQVQMHLSEIDKTQSSMEGKLDIILRVVQNLDRRTSR